MTLKWKSALVLMGLFVVLYMNWYWPWGLLFIYWAVPSLVSGRVFLVEELSRDEDPVLYWIVLVTWILLGLLMILLDAAPRAVDDFYALIWGLK